VGEQHEPVNEEDGMDRTDRRTGRAIEELLPGPAESPADDREVGVSEGSEGRLGVAVTCPEAGASAADAAPQVSRKVRRRPRRTRPRSKTIAMKRLTREELRLGALLYPPVEEPRPQTREECHAAERPCPWVSCKFHLYLDVNTDTGSIKINFPDLEPWELPVTCALDVADRGGITLEEVGEIMNLTRERIRQVEVRGLLKLKMASPSPDELGAGGAEAMLEAGAPLPRLSPV
jgi:hypothetical protein